MWTPDLNDPPRVPDAVVMVPVDTIHSNPETFQYRSGGNAEGEVGDHYIGKWEPAVHAKPLLLYERAGGKMEVVDGHHRLAFAKREREAGRGPEALPARVLREADGITPNEARIIGAYINFDQEFGENKNSEREMRDAADVFHQVHSGEVREVVPPPMNARREGQLHDAYAAGKLTEPAFAYVEQGAVSVGNAAHVAEAFGTPLNQVLVLEVIHSASHSRAV